MSSRARSGTRCATASWTNDLPDDRRGLDDRRAPPARGGRDERREAPGSWAGRRPGRSPCCARQRPSSNRMQPVVDQHRQELLDEERVALRRLDDAGADSLVEARLAEQVLGDRARLVLAETLEVDPRPLACLSTSRAAARRARGARCRRGGAGRPPRRRRACSTSSRNVASAQWTSSNRTTSGRSRRERLERACALPRRAPRSGTASGDRPIADATRTSASSSDGSAESFWSATSVGSRSTMPAAWRTASASGQNVIPSP